MSQVDIKVIIYYFYLNAVNNKFLERLLKSPDVQNYNEASEGLKGPPTLSRKISTMNSRNNWPAKAPSNSLFLFRI